MCIRDRVSTQSTGANSQLPMVEGVTSADMFEVRRPRPSKQRDRAQSRAPSVGSRVSLVLLLGGLMVGTWLGLAAGLQKTWPFMSRPPDGISPYPNPADGISPALAARPQLVKGPAEQLLDLVPVPNVMRLSREEIAWGEGQMASIKAHQHMSDQQRVLLKAWEGTLSADANLELTTVEPSPIQMLMAAHEWMAAGTAEGCANLVRHCIHLSANLLHNQCPRLLTSMRSRLPVMDSGPTTRSRAQWVADWRAALFHVPVDFDPKHDEERWSLLRTPSAWKDSPIELNVRAAKWKAEWRLYADMDHSPELFRSIITLIDMLAHGDRTDVVVDTVCYNGLHSMMHGLHELVHPDGPVKHDTLMTGAKLDFDSQQLNWLVDKQLVAEPSLIQKQLELTELDSIDVAEWFKQHPESLNKGARVLDEVSGESKLNPLMFRTTHIATLGQTVPSLLLQSPLSSELDLALIEHEYATKRIVVVDNLLRPEVLEELRRWCLESTIWHHPKLSYVGSYWPNGFSHPLVLHIANALQESFEFIRPHRLTMAWAYAYANQVSSQWRHGPATADDGSNAGIPIHADQATVNVNTWVTPDQFNLNPSAGGMQVWLKKPLANWSFLDTNGATGTQLSRIWEWLDGTESRVVTYKYNRAVMFDSEFFHATSKMKFAAGHTKRRINFTYLFGTSNITTDSSLGDGHYNACLLYTSPSPRDS
eukprot:TRINITY_DN24345_c0_g1_i3.p1 TRINITY_DN24345_c0_g1~~TRINITY_DN24345_c0_g1_i3.p1  ORF type:complete len:705 (+),score=91.90 TRINITY_DN24345_c0_g1_i3:77-2191(+)